MPAPLPPLPPAFAVSDSDVRPGGRSMVDILVDDHHEISELCARLRESPADSPATGQLAEVLVATLSRHLSAEEQYLYPTVRAALPDGAHLVDQELDEDREMLHTLQQLRRMTPDDPEYVGVVDAVTRLARHHTQRASLEIFPRLRAVCDENELIRLGNRVEIAYEAAPTRPHPATPVTPPANKVVDPAVGVVDKILDAVAGRTTRPEDL
ncbi:hemerythrin domain-containing protein [Planosporangium thailandense]|uniref:Hemerythrin domain-containing protein n=1 Tax=Planosporangium thailandense TaxID=765197 RepID=A0ABX0Y3T3_9ACTN|nr:hemerythrin domain-containing protein [Planosporangium thailandense]NJC72220.1 hemerythrin domain-containing protein [Planosporangium thailandense]